ncbi:MAG: hypothetical protein GY940_33765, partial [bacterium]|nr:hypothetical protein [bacterium]
VTGDIAFSGKEEEYEEALRFFNELREVLNGETKFLVIPGNHDVDRGEVDEFSSLYDVVNKGRVDAFLSKPKQVINKINPKFREFRNFLSKLEGNAASYEEESHCFWVKNDDERKVSFLGLNTSWACEGDEDRFNIALGYQQLLDALGKAIFPDKIVLMHHPPINWLKDMDSGNCRTDLFRDCQLLLSGHVHADNALVIWDPSDICLSLGANASYAHDGYIGFQFIDVEFIEGKGGVKVTVWPYKRDEQRNEIVPHPERWKQQKGKASFTIDTSAASSLVPPALP